MTDSSRICVVSGRYPATNFDAYLNHKAYCDRHGYTYIYCNWPSGVRNPYFNKISYLQEYVDYFDFLFWIDDDAFFINQEQPLEVFIPDSPCFLSICSSPDFKSISTKISSGQFLLRCDEIGKKFLEEVCRVDLLKVSSWWRDDLGYFSNGDQDAMVYLMETDEVFSKVVIHHYAVFNSRIENLLNDEPVFILHLTGTNSVKMRSLRRAMTYLRFSSSLLPAKTEKTLGVRRVKYRFVPQSVKVFARSLHKLLKTFGSRSRR